MAKPVLLRPRSQEENSLDALLQLPVVDYRCDRALYTTSEAERALATIDRCGYTGSIEVRRIMAGRIERSTDLRNWLEVATFLDMAYLDSNWMRDIELEERYRMVARNAARRENVPTIN